MRLVGTDDGPKPRPVASNTSHAGGPASHHNGSAAGHHNAGLGSEKVIVDPTKGGQVEAKEKAATHLALGVPEGTWVWAGAVSVLLVDLFR